MLMITAVGFVPKQPELTQFPSGSKKVSFEVCDKRRTREDGEWVEVTESAEFFVWGDEAERLAELLRPGLSVMAIGYQETAKWIDTHGGKHSKKIYRLVDVQIDRNRRPGAGSESSQAGQRADQRGQSSAAPAGQYRQQPATRTAAQRPQQQQPRQERSPAPPADNSYRYSGSDDDGMLY